ncbi:hypothetical protein pEaSNUABM50_00011 [Erwinia phage pEa_SNUABM_50]|uniref:Uncharacterized protein n=4 Tax=Eneladusvirus BF TaxID=2560751 RepID=A0A7L8ZM12_9CAUD|nr:hypothetical protein FDH34_gp012 [Serratia phage BF]QOI70950.1 hypothetical protein pEaSNUABM12_00012 [Erwinia phage pEa_SNUABM_12]QOI71495.1 hypothetical protein pEaSNUABM47_00011 [Erwinia phage pEa_SNUABM_47]QOI72035.1 hypothetical protein pEaSNUABM50_00011 [Erwinia phage pEa_SNUABM_50]QXO11158.1 hypothetical protein pEaSNUABM19_00012 [Erwinia phage pEa_SNUABM_19]QXO11707.1 hypothetical protein pEaSNUABM44_00011 [Erwinia phage pEa_SNUABM_44]QXO12258.1 hypothetical protein pEaSNUABM49_000
MKYVIYYDRSTKSWWGYWIDENENQLGEAVFEYQKEDCLILLGEVKENRRNLIQK